MNTLVNLERVYRPAPNTSAARRQVEWVKFSNENLKFTLDICLLHRSPYLDEVLAEVERRIDAGTWLDIDKPPPPLHNIPVWLVALLPGWLWRQKS